MRNPGMLVPNRLNTRIGENGLIRHGYADAAPCEFGAGIAHPLTADTIPTIALETGLAGSAVLFAVDRAADGAAFGAFGAEDFLAKRTADLMLGANGARTVEAAVIVFGAEQRAAGGTGDRTVSA